LRARLALGSIDLSAKLSAYGLCAVPVHA